MEGGAGNDRLDGSLGDDRLIGGPGNDFFTFFGGFDTLADFAKGQDLIVIPNGAVLRPIAGGTRLTFAGGEVVVEGVAFGTLQAPDLLFV